MRKVVYKKRGIFFFGRRKYSIFVFAHLSCLSPPTILGYYIVMGQNFVGNYFTRSSIDYFKICMSVFFFAVLIDQKLSVSPFSQKLSHKNAIKREIPPYFSDFCSVFPFLTAKKPCSPSPSPPN